MAKISAYVSVVTSIDCIALPEQGQATYMNADALGRIVTHIFLLFLMHHLQQLTTLTKDPLLRGKDQYSYLLMKIAFCKKRESIYSVLKAADLK